MAKLAAPTLTLTTLTSDFADISWDAIPILPACNADPDEAMLYSVWFDGIKQADREDTQVDYDDLTPGSAHTVAVQAVPRIGWDCEASDKVTIPFTTSATLTGCRITATSDIPLWYWDENGKFAIPHDSQGSCPMVHGMGFGISASRGAEDVATIANIHVDVMEYRKVPFTAVLDDPGLEGVYKGYVEVNGTEGTIHVTLTEYPQRTGTLTVITDPPEATVEIDGEEKGYTPIDIPIAFDPDEYRKRVLVKVSYEVPEAFQDRSRRVTIRPGLTTRYLTRLRAIARIKGTTEKDNTAKEVTFTMWAENRNRERIRHAQLYLLNMTNMKKVGSLIMPGSYITISYSSDFFVAGKNRLVCYWGDTGDRILSFKTITLPGATGDAAGIDEEWHDEDDATDGRVAIDAAYAKIT